MSELLKAKSEEFLQRLRGDLEKAEQSYKDVSVEMEEYVFVRSFITKELEFDGQKVDRKMMMNFGKQVYTRATVKANEKILVRVQNDLYIPMTYERALIFLGKRLDFLTTIADDYLKEIAEIKAHMTMTFAVMDPALLNQ